MKGDNMRWIWFLVVAVLFGSLCAALGQTPQSQVNEVKQFMRAKLTHSQKVLEGLTIEDFKMIEKSAQEMSLLSRASNWQVLQTPEYLQRSLEFQRTADAIRDAARKKNLDGAALAYVDMTMKCIDCHKYVRNVRMAKGEGPSRRVKAIPVSSVEGALHESNGAQRRSP
jgi:hypothetical protein